jgi:hypothetical protein
VKVERLNLHSKFTGGARSSPEREGNVNLYCVLGLCGLFGTGLFIWSLCRIGALADERMEMMVAKMKREGK